MIRNQAEVNEMLEYFIKASISLGLFYILYLLFLRKETFFVLNRFYLLGTILLSLLIPFITINLTIPCLEQAYLPIMSVIGEKTGSISAAFEKMAYPGEIVVFPDSDSLNLSNMGIILYFIGLTFFMSRLIVSLGKILLIFRDANTRRIKSLGYNYMLTAKRVNPFSFFNHIVLPESYYAEAKYSSIIAHEKAHVNQLHSIDLLTVELLTAFFWFNPFIYLYKQLLTENHEYLADQEVISSGCDSGTYRTILVRQVFRNHNLKFVSNCKMSFITRRLNMIIRRKSNKIKTLKILAVVPLTCILALIFSRADSRTLRTGEEQLNTLMQPISYSAESDYPSLCPIHPGDIKQISSRYGMRVHPITRKEEMHYGIDIAARQGAPVLSAADGTIVEAGYKEAPGNYIIIKHGDAYKTFYSQLAGFAADNARKLRGHKVSKGEVIGYVGSSGISTGPHLHYEIIKNGNRTNPEFYFAKETEDERKVAESDFHLASLNQSISTTLELREQTDINIRDMVAIIYDDGSEKPERPDVMPQIKTEDESMVTSIKNHILYPENARRDGVTGIVYIKFMVDKNGVASDFQIIKEEPQGYGFGDAVIKSLKTIPLTPALKDGKPVKIRMANKVLFKLN